MGIKLQDISDPKLRQRIREASEGPVKTVAGIPVTKKESPLEEGFLELWTRCGGPKLEREVGLIPGRLFRCDFVHRPSKTVIECEGYGIGHFGKAAFKKDADKYFILTVELGYTVIRLTKSLITEERVKQLVEWVRLKTSG